MGADLDLTAEEKARLKALIDAGEPLPDEYRFSLFREPREAELIWPGKTTEVTNVVLPFQCIEQIDEPRAEAALGAMGTGDLFSVGAGGRQAGGWSNKLIWGDNKLVLASLKGGPLRREIEGAGGLKLVYIDPPFDVGADFSVDVAVGDDVLTKEPSTIETIAYNDTWGRGTDSYAAMIYERIKLISELLSPDGVIFVHCDWHVNYLVRSILNEIFGKEAFSNEIIWYYYNKMQGNVNRFASNHDVILCFRRPGSYFGPLKESRGETVRQIKRVWDKEKGKIVNSKGADGKIEYIETSERTIDDVWRISMLQPADQTQNVGYATQKPETILERIIESSCKPGDLVADFFCGSGTTLAVAEKLGRKWIGADLGRFAIHTSRKRLIGVQRELKAEGKPYRAFEILNLGKYERQWFAGIDPTLPEAARVKVSAAREAQYLALILQAYQAQPVEQSPPFHGTKLGALVLVGPVDAPVTEQVVHDAVNAARAMNASRVDILGFEFEMGLAPRLVDEAKAKGVAVALRYIPKDVFDTRAVKAGQVAFYDVAYVEASATVTDKRARTVTVNLTDFGVAYRQDDMAELVGAMKPGGSKVTVLDGQVVKIAKAKSGEVTREVLTKQWTDWIDYWAVDFDYASKPETIHETVTRPDGSTHHVPQWTGRYIFENEWQSFRTRKNRALELTSACHAYTTPGRKTLAVTVIDIFGNDTTKVIGVEV